MGNLEPVLWRYEGDGTLDGSFGKEGLVVRSESARALGPAEGHAIVLDSSGRILVTGPRRDAMGFMYAMFIRRYSPDGTPDQSFG